MTLDAGWDMLSVCLMAGVCGQIEPVDCLVTVGAFSVAGAPVCIEKYTRWVLGLSSKHASST